MFSRLLKTLLALLGLVALYLGVLASEWLPLPREDQRQALDVLRQPLEAASGRSAFAVLWYLPYDLDGADPDALLAQDKVRLVGHRGEPGAFRSLAADRPRIPLFKGEVCAGFPAPCLPDARDPEGPGMAPLERYAEQVERGRALRGAGHYRYPFGPRDPLQVPAMGRLISLLRYANARRFVDGDAAGGLSEACLDLATWRRLRPTSNLLIHDMIAIAFAQTQAGLVSEMLGEWPAGEPLPAACAEALEPLAAPELDQCDVWRGEFAFLNAQVAERVEQPGDEVRVPHWLLRVMVNQRNADALSAPGLAAGCEGVPEASPAPPRFQDWAFDALGMVTHEVLGGGDFRNYRDRHDDHLDVLRTLRLQAWLRDQPDLAAAWANPPPDHLPLPERLTLDVARRELSLGFRFKSPHGPDHWRLPLPPPLPARPPAS